VAGRGPPQDIQRGAVGPAELPPKLSSRLHAQRPVRGHQVLRQLRSEFHTARWIRSGFIYFFIFYFRFKAF